MCLKTVDIVELYKLCKNPDAYYTYLKLKSEDWSNLIYFIMSTSKREEVSSHLRYIRQELRDLDQMLGQYGLLPELSELKEVYNSLDALHQLLSGKVKKKPKPEFDD